MTRKRISAVLGAVILAVAAGAGSPGPTNAEPPVGSMLVVPVCTPGLGDLTPVLRFYFEGTGPLTPLSDIPPYPESLVNDPSYAAFSSQGELFVANRHGGAGGSIARFTFDAAGDPVANGSITGNSLDNVHGLAFSPTGELFAANWANGTISRFLFDTAGNAIANGTIVTGQRNQGLAFSPTGELFAANDSSIVYRFVFDPVTQEPIPNGSFGISGSGGSHGLTFSAQGELFVADPPTDLVFRFLFDGLGNAVDNGTISVPVSPLGVAFSSAGELFVTSHYTGGISRFLFDVNGDAIPNGFTPTDHLGGPAILAGVTAPTPTPIPPVGGLAQLPDVSNSSGTNYIALVALAAAALLILAAGGWYARRRWLR